MKKVLFCLTLLLLCLDCAWAAELPDSVKDAVPPEAADILPEMDTSASHETLWQGLGDLWHSACAYVRTALETQASGAALLLGVVLLCSLAESCLAAADSPCVPRYVSVAGALAITLVAAGDFRRMMGLGVETMSQLEVFSKALLPTLSAAVAAGGGYITAGARQVATVFFTDLLISLIRQVLLPLLYACIAAAAADAVVPGHSLQKIGQGLRKCAAWALTALMLAFTGFLSVTGAATSAADALSTQLTRTAIATAVPVVGSIISDAAGTVLAGAGMLKGAIGVFGLLAVLAICLTPFITMAVQYLLYKLAAFLAGTVTQEPLAHLIGALGSAFGLMLVIVRPLLGLDLTELALRYEDYRQQIQALTEEYRRSGDAEFAALIADKTAAYIASKGDDLGITCTPRVEMEDRDGVPWPSAVTLDIPKDEALSAWLSTELAIDDAHQYWREADE